MTYAHAVIRWRWPVVIFTLLLAVAAAAGARNFELSNDYRIYFSPENPEIGALDALEQTYTDSDSVIFVIVPEDGSVFTPRILAAIGRLTEEAWQLPQSIRVDSLTNFQYSHAEGDELIVRDLVTEPARVTANEAAAVAEIARAEPEVAGRLVAEDGGAAVVAVTLQLGEDASDAIAKVARRARVLAAQFESEYPDLTVGVTGSVMFDQAFADAAEGDLFTIYPLMGAFLFIAAVLVLRSFLAAMACMVIVALSSATAMGLAGWSGIELTSPSAAGAVIVLIIAVADSIHLLVTTSAAMARGRSRREAIAESLRINMAPVFLTSLTTMIGFLSLNWSDAPPFRHLGNIAAAGAVIAWIYSIFLLPALMALVPGAALSRAVRAQAAMTWLAGRVMRHRQGILLAAVLVLAGAVAPLPALEINDDFVEYFSPDTEFRRDSDLMQAHLPGLLSIQFSVPSGEPGGINDPEYLRRLSAFREWLENQPKVAHVTSLDIVMRRLNRNMHGDDPAYYRLPESRPLAAQYLLLYEMSLPYGLDLNNRVDVDKSASRVTATLSEASTADIRALKRQSESWLAANFPSAADVRGTSVGVIFTFLTMRNVESMLKGTAIAFVLISLCLVVALRNVRLAGTSLLVNVFPIVVGFGLWALSVGEIGIYASFVATAALGMIVDFTVHFLSKYLRARREEMLTLEDALGYAFSMVGAPIWISAVILLVGFGALMLSDFTPNGYFGMMTGIVIACALVVDLLVLPALLVVLDRRREQDKPGEVSA